MAISRIGGATATAPSGGAVTLTLPGGIATGDLIIVCNVSSFTTDEDQFMDTADYTEICDLYANDTNDTNFGAFYKFHNGTDTTAVVSSAGDGNDSNCAALQVFRGVKAVADGGPFDVASTVATGTSSILANPPSIDTSGAAGIWVVIGGGGGHTAGAAVTFGAPTGYTTNFLTIAENDLRDSVIGMGYRSDPSDPEDPGAFTFSAADNIAYSWAAVTMALSPAAETGFTGWGIPI